MFSYWGIWDLWEPGPWGPFIRFQCKRTHSFDVDEKCASSLLSSGKHSGGKCVDGLHQVFYYDGWNMLPGVTDMDVVRRNGEFQDGVRDQLGKYESMEQE